MHLGDAELHIPADAGQDVPDPLAHLCIVAADSTNLLKDDRTLVSETNKKEINK